MAAWKQILCGAAPVVALAAQSASVNAAVVAYDGFAGYTPATSLRNQNPATTGFTGPWAGGGSGNNTNSATQGDTNVQSVATGLTYPNLSTTAGGSTAPANGRAKRALTTSYGAASTGTVWLSFLYQAGAVDQNYTAFELYNNSDASDANRTFQLGQSNAGGQGDFSAPNDFGIRVNDSGTLRGNVGPDDLNTHLFVMRVNFSTAAGGDSITVYNNPTATTEAGLTGGVTLSGFDFAFGTIGFANYGGTAPANFDEFRLGTTYGDVAAVPEPAMAGLVGVGMLLTTLRRRRAK